MRKRWTLDLDSIFIFDFEGPKPAASGGPSPDQEAVQYDMRRTFMLAPLKVYGVTLSRVQHMNRLNKFDLYFTDTYDATSPVLSPPPFAFPSKSWHFPRGSFTKGTTFLTSL